MKTIIREYTVNEITTYRLFALGENTETYIASFPTREQAIKAQQIYAMKKG